MPKYKVAKAVRSDLRKIWRYTFVTWSEEQANTYVGDIRAAFEKIANAPERVGRSYDFLIPGLRAYNVGKHLVFYTIPDADTVFIVRVLHEKIDFARNLK